MSSSDSDVEVSIGPVTLKDVKHFVLKEERKRPSRSRSLNFTPNAILSVQGSKEDASSTSTDSKSELQEIHTTKEWDHLSINDSNNESVAGSSSSNAYELYTAEEESNHSSQVGSNSYQTASEFKGGYGTAEEDLINFSVSYSDRAPSTSYEQIITDVEEDPDESALNDIDLKNNSLHIKAEKNDTSYFTCNESFQSRAVVNQSVISISDEEGEKSIEEGKKELQISNESIESDSIVVLSDDGEEFVNESLELASHTSFDVNNEIQDDPFETTMERIEKLLNPDVTENATNGDGTDDTIIQKERYERQQLTPVKVTSRPNKNVPSAHFKSGIPVSTSKLIPKQANIEKDLFKIPQTPINVNKRKLNTLKTFSPVAMYIKYSPLPLPLRHGTTSTKTPNFAKKCTFTYKEIEIPQVCYKPSTLQVSVNQEKMKLPPSYCKLIMNPLMHKHERMGQPKDAEMVSTVLAELERNPYNKLDESGVDVSFWTSKGAYEEV